MKIKNNKNIHDEDFSLIEKHYDYKIPERIKTFLKNHNGYINLPKHGIDIEYTSFVNEITHFEKFPTIYHTKEIIQQLEFINYINDFAEEDDLNSEIIEPQALLPIMEIIGGSLNLYIALFGKHKNKLFVVDNGDFGVCKVNLTFDELLDKFN